MSLITSLVPASSTSPTSNCSSTTGNRVKYITLIILSIFLKACAPIEQPSYPEEDPVVLPEPSKLSAEPIKDIERSKVLFAQTALNKLGYSIGRVDGIWGPRSAAAIREFEQRNDLISASGFLSELNLDELAQQSGLDPSISIVKPKVAAGLSSKISGDLKRSGPQLIIIENNYKVFVDANPYSKMLFELQPGTGIYVVAKVGNWYQIESINRKKGFIQSD